MTYEPTNIISRIEWCRLQQLLPSGTCEERAGWRAEEAGLVDALFGRDRTAVMREDHRSQLTRYQNGLEDGRALLCFQQSNSRWHDTDGGDGRALLCFKQSNSRWHDTDGGGGPDPLTAPAQVDRRPSQAPPPVPVEARR